MQEIFLSTERFYLRRMSMDDFDVLSKILKNPDVMYAWEHNFSDNDVRDWIERNMKRYEETGLGYFIIVDKKDGTIPGQAALMPDTVNGHCYHEIGYILDKEYWGRGYATECAKALSLYSRQNYPDKELILEIRPENTASINVAKRLRAVVCGEFTKNVHGKEMKHLIFKIPVD